MGVVSAHTISSRCFSFQLTLKNEFLRTWIFFVILRTGTLPGDFITQAPKPTPMEHQKGKERNDRVIYCPVTHSPILILAELFFFSQILLWFQLHASLQPSFSTSLTGLLKDLFLVFKRFTNPWVLHPVHIIMFFFSWIVWQWHLFLRLISIIVERT